MGIVVLLSRKNVTGMQIRLEKGQGEAGVLRRALLKIMHQHHCGCGREFVSCKRVSL